MLLKGFTTECHICFEDINEWDDVAACDGEPTCRVCAAGQAQEYAERPCHFCKKPMGRWNHGHYHGETHEEFAHEVCFMENVPQDSEEYSEWSNDWSC